MAGKKKVFDAQTVDGLSLPFKGFRGGVAVISIVKGSDLGGGAIDVLYNMEGDDSSDTIVGGRISDLSLGESWNLEIPFDTAITLELVGSSGASVSAWITQLQ